MEKKFFLSKKKKYDGKLIITDYIQKCTKQNFEIQINFFLYRTTNHEDDDEQEI